MNTQLEVLANQAAVAVRAVHTPGASAAHLQGARELYEQLRVNPSAHHIASRLVDPLNPPEVQHFGFQVLLAALRARSPQVLGAAARAESRAWLIQTFRSDRWAQTAPTYVRGKCAEVAAELARLEWPEQWPELTQELLALGSGSAPERAALALSCWCHVADLLVEESKEMIGPRRKELAAALNDLVETPAAAPQLISSLQAALQQHGANHSVVAEALRLCRALVIAAPVHALLRHSLDRIVQVGFGLPDLRDLAVVALGEWIDRFSFGHGACVWGTQGQIASHDLCRFVAMIGSIARGCVFDGEQRSYDFHRQVSELVTDFCVGNAAGLAEQLGDAELAGLWRSLMHVLRYPCLSMQADVITAMWHLARASRCRSSGTNMSQTKLPLDELVGVLFVHMFRTELLPAIDTVMDAGRSAWLLRCLGPVSSTTPPQSFQTWRQMVLQAHAMDLRDGDANSEERSRLFGVLKTKARELLCEVCRHVDAGLTASEGYGALCRHGSELVARALGVRGEANGGGPCYVAEYDSAVQLLERVGPTVLRSALTTQSSGTGQYSSMATVLEPSLLFLRQAMAPTGSGSETGQSIQVEFKRLEFLSSWAPFYKHFTPDIAASVVQRLIGVIENPPGAVSQGGHSPAAGTVLAVNMRRRALDSLISLGKNAALRPEQLEVLYSECLRLAPKLTPASRGKLCETLVAAIVAAPPGILAPERQVQLVEGLLEQATTSWRASELTRAEQPAGADRLAAALVEAATGAVTKVQREFGAVDTNPSLEQLRELKAMLDTYVGLITRATAAAGDHNKQQINTGGAATGHTAQLTSRIVQAWAPGIFGLLHSVAGLSSSAERHCNSDLVTLLSVPADNELLGMVAQKQGDSEDPHAPQAAEMLPTRRVQLVRSWIWEFRVSVARAVRACAESLGFWDMPVACAWLRSVAEVLPSQKPHIADQLLREVFQPLLGSPGAQSRAFERVPNARRAELCNTVVPALTAGVEQLLRICWQHRKPDGPAVPPLMVAPQLESAWTSSVIAVTRSSAALMMTLAGVGIRDGGLLANPDRSFVHGRGESVEVKPDLPVAVPQGKKKKQRNKNRFSALADEDAQMAQAPSTAACSNSDDPWEIPQPNGAAAFVVRHRESRTAVLGLLGGLLLELPEAETVQRALSGLFHWAAQVWNFAARCGDVDGLLVASDGQELRKTIEPGQLIHAASDALRVVPAGIVGPVANLVASPPNAMVSDAPTADAVQAPLTALSSAVQQPWADFVAATHANGKVTSSQLVVEATVAMENALMALIQLFRVQCRKIDLKVAPEHLYLCPALTEALNICKKLPNTTEADVKSMLDALLALDSTKEAHRAAIRVLLHEASPGFANAGRG